MNDGTQRDAVEVLLVEDDQGDVDMIAEGFGQSGSPVRLHVVGNGEQAMQFLHQAGGFADAPAQRSRPSPVHDEFGPLRVSSPPSGSGRRREGFLRLQSR